MEEEIKACMKDMIKKVIKKENNRKYWKKHWIKNKDTLKKKNEEWREKNPDKVQRLNKRKKKVKKEKYWKNIELSSDSSVEFVFVSELGYWVIVSSDGIKNS